MADNEVIGKVSSVSGEVTATDQDGAPRNLSQGDEIFANDVIATGEDSSVIFEFADGSRKGMPANAEITLNGDIYTPADAEPAAEGVSTGDAPEEPAADAGAASGASLEPMGTLTSAAGDVRAMGADGNERALEAGDAVYQGETVVTGDHSLAIFEFSDGSRKGLASNAEIRIDESMLDQAVAEAGVPTMDQVEAAMSADPSAAGGEPPVQVGTLTASEGSVKAVAADGSERPLEVGDDVFSGDTLVSGNGSTGIVQFNDGSARGIASNSEMRIEAPAPQVAEADVPTMEQVEADMAAAPSAAGSEPAEPIGTLTASEGDIKAVAADGSERPLTSGDEVFAGDTLVSGNGSTGIVQFNDGSARGIASNSEMRVEAPAAQVAEADVPTMEQVEADMAAAPSAAGGEPAEPIGTLTASEGDIRVVGADGSERPLAAGDEVFAGDTLVSGNSSTGIVQFSDGSSRGISSNSEVRLEAPQAEETQLVDGSGEGQTLEGAAAEEAAAEEVALGTGIPVGTVSAASGDVFARGADGSERKLEAGDEVNADETVIADQNSTAIFNFYDGSTRGLASNSEMTLDGRTLDLAAIRANQPDGAIAQAANDIPEATPVQAAAAPAATQAPVVPVGAVATVAAADQEVSALQQAILDGADPSEEAEATAAGGEAGSEGGHDAVFLARSGQATTPDSGYDTVGIGFAALPGLLEVDPRSPEFGGPNTPPLLFHTLVQHVKEILDLVLDLVEDLLESVADLVREILDLVETFLNDLNITNLVDGLIDAIQNVANDVVDSLLDAVGRAIDLVGGGADDHGHIGDGVADNATTLFIAFWAADDTLDRLEQVGVDILGLDPQLDAGYDNLKAEVNDGYGKLADIVKAEIIEGIRDLQNKHIAENGSTLDQVQGAVIDGENESGLGLRAVEGGLDEAALGGVKDTVTPHTGSEGLNIGGRASIVGNAVADEVYSDEDGSGVVGDLRGPRDGDSTEAADGTILGETYDVADEGADAADTIWTGEKYEDGKYTKHGDGVVVDAGLAVKNAIAEEDPERVMDAANSLAVAESDLEEAGTEAMDIPDAVGSYAETNVDGASNIAGAVKEAVTLGDDQSAGNDSSPSLSMNSSQSSDVPGVNRGATADLMGDSGGEQSINLHTIHVAEDHESAVFHLSVDGLDPGESGFDIDNFHRETDSLVIDDLLGTASSEFAGADGLTGASLSKYLQVEDDGEGGATLSVSDGTGSTPTQIHLQGVDLTHDENGDVLSNEQILDIMIAGGSLSVGAAGGGLAIDSIDPASIM